MSEFYKRKILDYIRKEEKLKLCILNIFLEQDKLSESEVKERIISYYPTKLYSISKAYNALKTDGFLIYKDYKETLSDKEKILKIFEELKPLIDVILSKEWGKGDIINTLGNDQIYIIEKILIRGGLVSKELLFSDIARDFHMKQGYYSSYSNFESIEKEVCNILDELEKSGYIQVKPMGYSLPDFVTNDFLTDPFRATKVLGELSKNLWMAFDYEPYLSFIKKIENEIPEMCKPIFSAIDYFQKGSYNDALDYLYQACEKFIDIIYQKVKPNGKEKTIHPRLVEIWQEQDLLKNDPALSELGKKAAMFLSSAIFISKWIRDKTSHPLVKPTADSVRLALISLLIAIDVAAKLKLLK